LSLFKQIIHDDKWVTMSIPTNAEILALLDRLSTNTADDLETRWLEFKPWYNAKDDMKVAVEYAVITRGKSVSKSVSKNAKNLMLSITLCIVME